MPPKQEHALVIGAGFSGLVAAAFLVEHFKQVTILERENELPDSPETRRGVPQGRHIHVLLDAGAQILEERFPGFSDELVKLGACRVDPFLDTRWFHFGAWKQQVASDFTVTLQSRPLLEWNLRKRVAALPGVCIRSGHRVESLVEDGATVTGVRCQGQPPLLADLVVNASGRNTKAIGGQVPPETKVQVDVRYTSCRYELPPVEFKTLVIYPTPPEPRAVGAQRLEDGSWMVTLIGWCGLAAEASHEGFIEYAEAAPHPLLANLLRAGQPCSSIATYRYQESRRAHYENLANPQQGLVVVGDALCSFDPVFGQGMATSAMVLQALHEELLLAEPATLSKRFYQRAAQVVHNPWTMSTNEDFRFPAVIGKRPRGLTAINWYTKQLHHACAMDPVVAKLFGEVMHLRKPPEVLLKPTTIARVLRHVRARPRAAR